MPLAMWSYKIQIQTWNERETMVSMTKAVVAEVHPFHTWQMTAHWVEGHFEDGKLCKCCPLQTEGEMAARFLVCLLRRWVSGYWLLWQIWLTCYISHHLSMLFLQICRCHVPSGMWLLWPFHCTDFNVPCQLCRGQNNDIPTFNLWGSLLSQLSCIHKLCALGLFVQPLFSICFTRSMMLRKTAGVKWAMTDIADDLVLIDSLRWHDW